MAVSQKKTSKSRKRSRMANKAMKPVGLSNCPNCGAPKLPHRVCLDCGFYAGRQVLTSKEETTAAE